jgi:acetyl-CoA C-acetyltransferase
MPTTTTLPDTTPVIIGVGEASERIDAADYAALSPADLAAAAARNAIADAAATGDLTGAIDVIAAIRQFEVSGPGFNAPFGCSDNFPRSVARRIGANPTRAIWEKVGGQGPQHLVNEFADAIAAGEADAVLLVGSEAISTVRHLTGLGQSRDWAETVEGQLEDRGLGLEGLLTAELARHGARTPIHLYALFENARRARLGLDRASYATLMGELFAPFTAVAAHNPHAMAPEQLTAGEIVEVTPRNRLVADPFPRRVIARDQANQGAAVLLTSLDRARALGVPQDKLIYLHGGADVAERTPIQRQDLSRSPATVMACRAALAAAETPLERIDIFDLYSCFPIAVFNVLDGLGLGADEARPLTVTGGLPFFGGAGNNYSMHAIASMVARLRERPGAVGLVGANGGFLSKYSVGVYSTTPRAWTGFSSTALQAEIDGWPAPALVEAGEGVVETYTIDHGGKAPSATVVGRTADGARFVAMSDPDDPTIVNRMMSEEPLGASVSTAVNSQGRTVLTGFVPAA